MRSIIQHLRFPFSYLLLPVYLFALVYTPHGGHFLNSNNMLLFVILHLLVYPSSNAFNSIQDKDAGSIGLIKNPLPIPNSLGKVSIIMDCIALILAGFISTFTVIFLFVYIVASRLYSYRKIRLKQYPFIGFLTVFIFQGAWIFVLVSVSLNSITPPFSQLIMLGLAASFLIGAIYPLSQIYQHKQDLADGVKTISYKLGKKGTFIFSGIFFLLGSVLIVYPIYLFEGQKIIWIYLLFSLPSLVYFNYWFYKVVKDEREANFKNTMVMNLISATCMNGFFMFILLDII